ncbi:type II secretion system F family protein [Natronomonas halophila]|uniref:type II secretion system F family protein n=1 Tax=Natronomonas halophila TaxID=2747817 RepID=UPI0015B574C8|nr:type II secretion system F family protein [Natronomonas halophila]QLD87089.1 type II secretion system F family protein [Natronomonas halophila]
MSLGSVGGEGLGRRYAYRLVDAFDPLYQRLFDEDDEFVVDLERKLAEARMATPAERYLRRALAFGFLSGVALWLFGVGLTGFLFGTGAVDVGPLTGLRIPNETLLAIIETARVPFLVAMTGLVLGTVGFIAVFGAYLSLPYSRASARQREIDTLLPDAVSFMYALSLGGLSQVEIIETMATSEDTYGEVSNEFRTILQETRYFDTDYRSAIQKRSAETPSAELSQFLTDMLSIIDSGGSMTDFLEDKKDVHFRAAKGNQEQTLETLELFTEMYITISLFPLLLIIILVILDMIRGGQDLLLYATVYVLIPGLGLAFLVIISTVRADEPGDGYLELEETDRRFEVGKESTGLDLGLVDQFTGSYRVFDRIADSEGTHETLDVVKRPHVFLRDNPFYTLAITVPASLMFLVVAVLMGAVPVSWSGVIDRPVWSTLVYVYTPLFTVCVPLAVFWEWNVRRRRAILDGLSENLRKLASANATGLTLLESIKVVADTTPGRLGEEFENMYAKSHYGMHLKESLVVFNNKYHIPRLARTLKLISKAQEISSQISSVLSTAAKAAETQEDIERDRRQRALMQVAIIIMTFLTLLGVMALMKARFLDVMAEVTEQSGAGGSVAGGGFGASVNIDLLSLLFFHAVTLQAILGGIVCGYIKEANVISGVKYVVVLSAAALAVWLVVA